MPEIVIGIIIALLVYELLGYSPGGIITAAFVALYSRHWEFVLCTVLVSLVAAVLVHLLSRAMVLYGKRLFTVSVLVALLLSLSVSSVATVYAGGKEFAVIGHIIPGLLAKDIYSQGTVVTLASLALTVGLIRIACFAGKGWLW